MLECLLLQNQSTDPSISELGKTTENWRILKELYQSCCCNFSIIHWSPFVSFKKEYYSFAGFVLYRKCSIKPPVGFFQFNESNT